MKRTHLFGTMMACTLAAAVSLGAQDRPTTPQSERDGKTVTVTGCLKSGSSMTGTTGTAGTAGTAGTTGSTASASARSSFILTDATVGSGSGSTASAGSTSPTGSTAGTAGTSGSTSPSASAAIDSKTYSLVGGQPSELEGYVNSKVEIRGTLDEKDKSSSTAGATATPSATPSMAGMSHGENAQLRVTSVRQIAASCSGQ